MKNRAGKSAEPTRLDIFTLTLEAELRVREA